MADISIDHEDLQTLYNLASEFVRTSNDYANNPQEFADDGFGVVARVGRLLAANPDSDG